MRQSRGASYKRLGAWLARPARRVPLSKLVPNWGRKGVRGRFYLVILVGRSVEGLQLVPKLANLLPP
jgi:hypothetical protein